MVIGIFVGGIFLGFSLGFATMALVSARNNRLQGEEAQETTGQSYLRSFSHPWG